MIINQDININDNHQLIEDVNNIVVSYVDSIEDIIQVALDCKYKLVDMCNVEEVDLYDIHDSLLELSSINNELQNVEETIEVIKSNNISSIQSLVTEVESIIGYN